MVWRDTTLSGNHFEYPVCPDCELVWTSEPRMLFRLNWQGDDRVGFLRSAFGVLDVDTLGLEWRKVK